MIRTFIKQLCLFSILLTLAWSAFAEEESSAISPNSKYHALSPSFVTNFGEPSVQKLKFVKADISLRVTGDKALQAVREHNALIRHRVVMILSQQTEETMAIADGQEKLRLLVLEQVRQAMKEETGEEHVDDLLFTTFVIQR